MSCDSTTGSISTSSAAFAPSPNPRWFWKLTLALLDGITRRRQYDELLELDDRLLADIGLSRTIVGEARQCYFSGWRDDR
ncbi:DUF1127 domain-containing protein [Bradyrhizobium sp. CSS354]|jgi:uncharacterized protein YjiS (DUF1127 family)|uniref:DUF1127 domain-containing protein n=1 Tax=unclassified Bradyrhizobium TaxID=2631580 RepID=UPI0023AE9683|nr:DUF1127 domain-containing protein [Bradyrhizobium sp. CSS354]MDE5459773.1 DUF1127 domain-containing protein [Bradyrhizobium sp. CSS354]